MLTVLRIISSLISGYMLLIFIRVLLTWFSRGTLGKAEEILGRVTDPYLNYFRRFSFMRIGMIDMSPVAGIIVLVVVLNMLNTILAYGKITVGITLSIILAALWSAVSFLLTLYIVLIAIRLFMELFQPGTYSPFKTTLDALVNPVTTYVKNTIAKKNFLSYKVQMAMTGGIFVALSIAGDMLVKGLSGVLLRIPF